MDDSLGDSIKKVLYKYGIYKYEVQQTKGKITEQIYREKIEQECLAYTRPTARNKVIISKIKNISILKEWLSCGFELEEFRLLENSGANMQLAFEAKKIACIWEVRRINMSLLEKVCKELGVEVGEKWKGNDGYYYKITEDGMVEVFDKDDEPVLFGYEYWEDIFSGDLKPVWKPKKGDSYYVPNPSYNKESYRADGIAWTDNSFDNWAFKEGLAFKTKEEAIECANKMLEAIKESN